MKVVFIATFLLCLSKAKALSLGTIDDLSPAGHIQLNVPSPHDKGAAYNLNLSPRAHAGSILHPNIQVISVGQDEQSGQSEFHVWAPSHDERRAAEDVHLDSKNLAVVRVSTDENGNRVMRGTVDGMVFEELDGAMNLAPRENSNFASDYINLGLPPSLAANETEVGDLVVEVALVCDKEWGDLFQHNRRAILDYWSVFFWDVNMRYQTLPSVNISFVITSVTVISTFAGQPFIEESRNEEGKARFSAVLSKFGDWMQAQLDANLVPKYDIAVLALRTQMAEGYAGMAYLSLACSASRGVGIFIDGGKFGSVVATHEIAHILGANHDNTYEWCRRDEPGFIMDNNVHKGYFFSYCSDRVISDFVKTERASCLKRIDHTGNLPVQPGFESALFPTLQEQCKMFKGVNATLGSNEESNCENAACWFGGYYIRFRAVENSPCQKDGQGHCFRGRCIPPSRTLVNIDSGECLLGGDRFNAKSPAIMAPCSEVPNPMERFSQMPNGYLAVPYSSANATENADKCLTGGMDEGHEVDFDLCTWGETPGQSWYLWPTEDGTNQFLLMNGRSQACAKQVGDQILSYRRCDMDDSASRWKFQ